MYISMNWIRDFVDLSGLDLHRLIHQFTLSTAEVEEITVMGEDLRDVVAAKILSVENHPDSKKLHLLKVDDGTQVIDVVCGAPNVREGLVVPFVREGGRAGGMDIAAATIAGFVSHGMCCSARELGISADHAGLMELPEATVLGTDITHLYPIRDLVFEVDNKSLTNRPDLWGHYGIAREFAALSGRELKPLEQLDLSSYDSLSPVDIQILDQELCYRYSGLKVGSITKKVSPISMQIRLFYCGSRVINLLADLTNYLMLEMGQPMHAFDCGKVSSIEVKRFPAPFSFQTLDGVERAIDESTLMICSQGKPVAVAGIMGGLDSEIAEDTHSLLLESANFDGISVRKSSTRLGLRTDASMRYEKVLDPEMTLTAIRRFLFLLTQIDPGVQVLSQLTDVSVKSFPEIKLSFDKSYVNRYTGIEISNGEIVKTLTALGFGVQCENDSFLVEVPSWRRTKDVTIKADIIEEITRIYGYDNFRVVTTSSPLVPQKKSPGHKADNFAKDLLVQRYHLHETHSYLWTDDKKCKELGLEPEENVRLINAQTPDHAVLRNELGLSLLITLGENKGYAGSYGIFEIARVVEGKKPNGDCNERKKLGIALFSKDTGEKDLFYRMIGILKTLGREIKREEPILQPCAPLHAWQHPRNTSTIFLGGKTLGTLSTVHPTVLGKLDKKAAVVIAQLDMDDFAALLQKDIAYQAPSKFPGIDYDLSLTLPAQGDASYSTLEAAWKGTPLLTQVTLVDLFSQGEVKSITLRFAFSSQEKTLSREEVQEKIDGILGKLQTLGVSLRC